ncbi:MAG: VOC family protein [Pseudomonadota bacterium]
MAYGHFLWTDLSTYDFDAALVDYERLFDWAYQGDETYTYASLKQSYVAGIHPMPDALAQMNMPSFWMSHIHVKDLDKTLDVARAHKGVSVELGPFYFNKQARVALLRDPAGAGFMIYEGPEIAPAQTGTGRVALRYHHLADVRSIQDFYSDLFDWRFRKLGTDPWPKYEIKHPDGDVIAIIEEVPADVRGIFSYWIPAFEIADITAAAHDVKSMGGRATSHLELDRIMVKDRQGAHFMLWQDMAVAEEQQKNPDAPAPMRKKLWAWKAGLGLISIWAAVLMNVQSFWGALFLLWLWPSLTTGRADFIEPVTRQRNPYIYWALIATWAGLSLWLIGYDIYQTPWIWDFIHRLS